MRMLLLVTVFACGEASLTHVPQENGIPLEIPDGPDAPKQPDADPAGPVTFSADIGPMLDASCSGCHRYGGRAEDTVWLNSSSYSDLINRPTVRTEPPGTLVVPGDPSASAVVQRVSGEGLPVGEGPMPPRERLAPNNIDLFEQWVAEGAVQ